jgi:hypothetical protein
MVLALNKGTVEIARTATPYLIQDVLKGFGQRRNPGRDRDTDL